MAIVLCGLLIGGGANAAGMSFGSATLHLPEPAQLVRAQQKGDTVELERLARRIGVAKLLRLAQRSTKRDDRVASLVALGMLPESVQVLPELAPLVADADVRVAEAADHAIEKLTERVRDWPPTDESLPPDLLERTAAALLTLAKSPTLAVDLRVEAILALEHLPARRKPLIDAASIDALVQDVTPEVRREAVELLMLRKDGDATLDTIIANDDAPEVAARAAAVICRDVPFGAAAKAPRVEKLSLGARDRVKRLAEDVRLSVEQRADLIGCLRASSRPEDRAVLDKLASGSNDTLKRRARAYRGK
jgi:hypothetical protein